MTLEGIGFPPGPIGPIGPGGSKSGTPVARTTGPAFGEVFDAKHQEIRISAHAQARLSSRGIDLDAARMAKLTEAVNRAASKGAKESLVLMEDLAVIVSVKNRTVITAVDGASLKENVFTNIDSAVIA